MNSSFGVIEGFAVGDVVLWSRLGTKKTGVISDLKLVMQGGREVAHADVFCFENQKKHDVLCINLKIITKTDIEA
tara:strand:- start:138 stop:362 length:225 start_codon:yes stop_codon:yes gene_type:complete